MKAEMLNIHGESSKTVGLDLGETRSSTFLQCKQRKETCRNRATLTWDSGCIKKGEEGAQ